MKKYSDKAGELQAWMLAVRRHIHQNPELSSDEYNTAEYISATLAEIGISCKTGIAGTGITAETGPENAPCTVGLRADMDGLPIQEETGLDFSSRNAGVMHACGHDGHVAMLLGAARMLQETDLPGRVRFIFQPAEESGNGAERMIREGAADGLSAIFSGHVDTHFDTGVITVDEGIVCAYADPFVIQLRGSGGHAARPHECKDALVAAAGLVTSLQSLVAREVDPNHSAVLTVGKIRAGEIHNIIADEAILEGTIRSTHPDARKRLLSGLRRMVESVAGYYDVRSQLLFPDSLPAVINDCQGASIAKKAAVSVVSEERVCSQGPSSLGGEDFAFYLQNLRGCMVRFGAKPAAASGPAHSSTFDFDERVLSTGAAWYASVAMHFFNETMKE